MFTFHLLAVWFEVWVEVDELVTRLSERPERHAPSLSYKLSDGVVFVLRDVDELSSVVHYSGQRLVLHQGLHSVDRILTQTETRV